MPSIHTFTLPPPPLKRRERSKRSRRIISGWRGRRGKRGETYGRKIDRRLMVIIVMLICLIIQMTKIGSLQFLKHERYATILAQSLVAITLKPNNMALGNVSSPLYTLIQYYE